MLTWKGKHQITVVSACMNASGLPTFVANVVEVTQDEYENGVHYDLVEAQLTGSGYDEPYVHFDEFESPRFLVEAITPQLTDGSMKLQMQEVT